MHGTEKYISLTQVNQIVWNTKIVWGSTNCMTLKTNVWDNKKMCVYNAMQKKKWSGNVFYITTLKILLLNLTSMLKC